MRNPASYAVASHPIGERRSMFESESRKFPRWLALICSLALSIYVASAEPEFATDKMSDAELREYRNRMRSELQRLLETVPREKTPNGTAYLVYYCSSATIRRVSPDSPLNGVSTIRESRRRASKAGNIRAPFWRR